MEIKSTEFFRNITKLPPPDTKEFKQLIDWEIEKITGGVTVNGVFFSGWLYWHINHWWIRIDDVDRYGNDIRKEALPELRDNEWIRAENLEKARIERKGYIEVGARQTAKSETEASYFGMNAILYKNSQNVIVCGNDNDLSLLKDKVDFGLKHLWDGINIPRLDKTWRSNQIKLGYKKPNGDDEVWSYIVIRNAKDGNNTEVAAGTTAKTFIMDEVGKYAFASTFKAAEPAFKGKNGWRATPLLMGCLTENNKVFTKDGNLVSIKSLKKEQGIIGFNSTNQTISIENILHINPPQEKQCYEITTKGGLKIECSYDHPILIKYRNKSKTINKKTCRIIEFVETKDLQEGMLLSIPDIIPLMGNKEMKHPYFIGAIIGDGNYSSDRGIRFYNEDEEIWDYFDSINKKYKVFNSYITKKGRLYKEVRFFGGMKYLKEIGIYGQSKRTKDLPIDIHLYREQDICELIAGLFDTDGCIVVGGEKNNYIFYSSCCEKLIDSLKLLLIRLGIHSNKCIIKPDNRDRKIRSREETYTLNIADKKSINRFIDKIPLKIERKKEKLLLLKKFFETKGARIDSNYPGIRFDKISKITEIGNKPVYNLTTDSTHTYLANSIITHNTGGAFENGKDAENFFFNPDANNFLAITDEATNKKTGLFLSGLFRQDSKIEMSLSDWLRNERGVTLEKDNELKKIKINVTDKEKALATIEKERASSKTNPDRTIHLKQIMYFPLTVEECFLSASENIFDIEAAKRQKAKLLMQEKTGIPVTLHMGENGIYHTFSDKQPISSFPLKSSESKDAPVVILEFPIDSPPHGLYVSGQDPYRQGKAAYSDSLGSVYVYKRMHNIVGEKYQDMLVAYYTARPDKKEVWDEQARLLIKYYNARALCENDEMSFIDYMISKGDSYYLEKQPEWLKEIVPNSTVSREFGIHRSAEKIRDFLHGCLKKYTEEILFEEKDDNGNIIKQITGMNRIFDPMLLEEIIQYNDEGNFDRIVAFELTLALAMKLDPIYGRIGKSDDRVQALYRPTKKNLLFTESRGMFQTRKNRLFV